MAHFEQPIVERAVKFGLLYSGLLLVVGPGSASAQVLVANDDAFGIPFGKPLIVEAPGVLDNDLLAGEPAGENGATAHLITNVSHGSLTLNPDGSFTYTPGVGFDGIDGFAYRAYFDTTSDQATVTLTACTGGPQVLTCWNESAFLARLARSGYATFREGFEEDAVWGSARTPLAMPSVSSQGILWQSNHPEAPASNNISTTSGPPRTGQWAIFDPEHGYATGTPFECDVDNPAPHCLFNDGFTGTREPGLGSMHGVGGFISGTFGANVAIILDGGIPIGGGQIGGGYQFFGVIDTRPGGFTQFEFRELDGKVGQALFVFGDDFSLATQVATSAPEITGPQLFLAGPNPTRGSSTLHFSLSTPANVRLVVYDLRGRLVRELVDAVSGPGVDEITWDGRDRDGVTVPAGVYFGKFVAQRGAVKSVVKRKIVILH